VNATETHISSTTPHEINARNLEGFIYNADSAECRCKNPGLDRDVYFISIRGIDSNNVASASECAFFGLQE
jgi:hypothetical protein